MRRWIDFILLFALIGMVVLYSITVAEYNSALLEARRIIQALEMMFNSIPIQPQRGA